LKKNNVDAEQAAEAAVADARAQYDAAVARLSEMQASRGDKSRREFTLGGQFYEFTEKVKHYSAAERTAAEEALRQATDALQQEQGRLNDLRHARTVPAGRAPLR
jgi:hypothetical protein